MGMYIGSTPVTGVRYGTNVVEKVYYGATKVWPWSPEDLNAELWYDPSDLSSLWQNTAGSTPVASDTDLVGRMNNKGSAGSGMNALQGTGSLKPQYKTSGGLRWILPDGVDDFLLAGAHSNFITASAFDLMVAFTVNSIGTDSATIPANDLIFGAESNLFSINYRSTGPTVYGYNNDGSQDSAGVAFSTGTAYVGRFRHDSGNIHFSLNGGSEATTASGNTSDITQALKFFGRAATGAFSDLRFFGMVGRKTAFTTDEAANLLTWLGAKAGLTL